MAEYHVVWEIDLDAKNETDAALTAQRIQRNESSAANIFQVHEMAAPPIAPSDDPCAIFDGPVTWCQVDLDSEEEEEVE